MPKKLIITLEYPPQVGGIATYIYNMASSLSSGDFVIYAPQEKGDKDFDARHPWKVYRKKPYWPMLPFKWTRMFFQIKDIIKKEGIDEIHVHHVLPVGYIVYLIKKFFKINFTLFFHGTDLQLASSNPSKRNKLIFVCRSAKTIVVNSEFLKRKLLDIIEDLKDVRVLYPCPSEKFFEGADQNWINDMRTKLALSGRVVMMTVARMEDGKGYPHLLRLLPKILEKAPNAVLLVIGDGPKRNIIMDIVQKKSLQNIVRFLGTMPYEDLARYYHLADLFVLLTHKDGNNEEGWGTVFLEAAASGLPVVAGRSGGVEEAVLHGETGYVVDVYQEASVVAAITNLLTDKPLAAQYGSAGKERAVREFRWADQIKKLS